MPRDLAEDRQDVAEDRRGPTAVPPPSPVPGTTRPGTTTPDAAPPASEAAAPPAAKAGGSRRRIILPVIALAALAGIGWYGYHYWTVGRFTVSTDDAYVQADFAIVAPKLTGYVARVPAVENHPVRAGDPLVVLDDGDYRDALSLAQAQLDGQAAAVRRIDAQATAADAGIAQAEAQVEAAEAQALATAADLARYQRLQSSDVASAQKLESAQAADAVGQAGVREAEAAVATAKANRDVITAQRAEAEASLAGLAASRDKAQRDLDATVLRAPFDGTVGNLSVAAGDLVAPGKRLLAVVPLSEVYVEANFKETQIELLAPGTQVRLDFDAYPGRELTGTVQGVAPAAGSQFSLLPPENATGNFTKVVQRVPVRIAVPADAAAKGWLRPGLSVQVSADTRTTPAPAAGD